MFDFSDYLADSAEIAPLNFSSAESPRGYWISARRLADQQLDLAGVPYIPTDANGAINWVAAAYFNS